MEETRKLNILYAEDDPAAAAETTEGLEEYGFRVQCVHDGNAAWNTFLSSSPDIVLLDYQMPGKNGLEVFRLIHDKNSEIPVLILSSYTEYCVTALKKGTADFIRKDAEIEEIAIRLRNAWRGSQHLPLTESPSGASAVYYLSERTTFNADHSVITICGNKIPLTQTLGALFTLLCKNQNHPVSVSSLCTDLWNLHNSSKRDSLRNYISELRKILQDDPDLSIRSHYRKGYSLVTLDF